jgi:quercetin dioxygenase-like cupin family protein
MDEQDGMTVDLQALANAAAGAERVGALWSLSSPQLNANLLRFRQGDGVAEHTNHEVDVIGVVMSGEGTFSVGERSERVRTGQLFFIPRGTRRAIRAESAEFVYLTFHQRRGGLMPRRETRPRA